MVPMTIDQLKIDGQFKVGYKFKCTHSAYDTWTVGKVYEVIKYKGDEIALTSDRTPQLSSLSTFVLVDVWNAGPTHVQDEGILQSALGSPDDKMNAIVNKPKHYSKWAIEPITFIMMNGFDFWRGNIIKYASRAGSKLYDGMDAVGSEITDLEKVRRYAEMRINQLKGESIL